jgi:hypothetical protein
MMIKRPPRRVFVMSKAQMLRQLKPTVYATVAPSSARFAGTLDRELYPTVTEATDAATCVLGGVWSEVPTHTRTVNCIKVDADTIRQIHKMVRGHRALDVDIDDTYIVIPDRYTLVQSDTNGAIQYALVSDGKPIVIL